MKIINVGDFPLDEITKMLTKKPFDEVELPSYIREANVKIFGSDLPAVDLVRQIVDDVRRRGDTALFDYTKRIDRTDLSSENLVVTAEEFAMAEKEVDSSVVESLKRAAENIRRFHVEQLPKSWITYRDHASILGQAVVPLGRVGIYVPGGTAAYPSSVLMNAIPANVAGVPEIIMASPPKNGRLNPYVLIAAKLAGVHKIFKIGGAQAIAALAFGTESVPRVDKVTGPGNIFVTLAKKEVYGHCDIDMLAGPSEILIVADDSADPKLVAADLLSQAEHDPLACPILISADQSLTAAAVAEVDRQLAALPRKDIASAAIEENGLAINVNSLDEAVTLANISAPEHLELLVRDTWAVLPEIKTAGAVFLGSNSPEPLGDYLAGPNHVLPTGGTARFFSVLNVETFLRRMSLISYSRKGLSAVSDDVIRLAEAEGLDAHARAVLLRKVD